MSVGLGTAVGFLTLDIQGFAKGIDTAMSDMGKLQNKVNTVGDALSTVGQTFSRFGGLLTAGITTPIAGAAAASVKFGTQFDSKMSQVKAVSGATTKEFEKMRDAAIKWGEKTVYTADEAGDALYYMSLAGWDTQESIDGLGPILSLAAAGNLDLGRTSDIVTDAMTALNLEAGKLNKDGVENTTHFTNVLSAAMSNSNTDVDQLGEAFKYVAPLAGSLGIKADDLAVALGLMANVGVKASQAGTGLRQALNGMINPTDKAKKIMDKYGVSLFDSNGKTKDFRQVMVELRKTFGDVGVNAKEVGKFVDGLGVNLDTTKGQATATKEVMKKFGHDLPRSDFEKLNAIVNIFGVRALPGVLGIIEQSDETFNDLTSAIDDSDEAFVKCGDKIYTMEDALKKFGDAVYSDDSFEILGSAAGMAETQMDNLKGDWTRFTSALGTSQILISDMVKGTLREFVQKLTDIVTWFNNLKEGQREQIVKWAGIVAAIGPALVIFGKVISGIVGMVKKFNALKTAFGIIKTSIVNFGEAFKLAKAGFTTFASQTSKLGAALGGLSTPILIVIGVVAALVAAFVDLWKNNEEFRDKIISIWDGIKAKFAEAGDRIVDIFNKLGFSFEDFKDLLNAGLELLKKAWKGFCELLAPVFEGAFDAIASVIGGIVDLFVGIVETISGIIKGFKDGDWSMLWQGLGDVVKAAVDTISGILDGIGEAVWGMIQTVANWLGADWDMSWDDAKSAVKDWFNSVVDWIKSIPEKIKDLPKSIQNFLDKASDSVKKWVPIMVEKAQEMGKKFIQAIADFFGKLPERVAHFLSLVIPAIAKWASRVVQKAIQLGKDFIAAVVDFLKSLPEKMAHFLGLVIPAIAKWAVQVVQKAIQLGKDFIAAVVDFLGKLPGKFGYLLGLVLGTLAKWAVQVVQKAIQLGKDFIAAVVNFLKELPSNFKKFLGFTIDKIKEWAKQAPGEVKKGIKALPGIVTDFLKNLPKNVFNIGKEIVKGLINGVMGMAKWLKDKLKDFCGGVIKGMKDALDIHSPSRVVAKEIGEPMAGGVSKGFTDAMPDNLDKMQTCISKGIGKLDEETTKETNKVIIKYTGKAGAKLATELAKSIEKQNKKNKETGAKAAQVLVDAATEKWNRYSMTHDTTLAEEAAFWKKIVNECKKGSDAYYTALQNYQNANQSLVDSVKTLKEDYREAWNEVKDNLISDIQAVMDDYEEALNTRTENIKSQLGDMFTAYEVAQTDLTKETLLANLQSQIDAMEEWDRQMNNLANRTGITEIFLDEVREMGIGATEQLKLLNSMSDEELSEFIKLWNEKNEKAAEIAKNELAGYEKECEEQIEVLIKEANSQLKELEKTYKSSLAELGAKVTDQSKRIGENIVGGIKEGISSYSGELYSYMDGLCSSIVSTAKNSLKIESPSKVFANQVGKWLPLGIAEGFSDAMPTATNEIEDSLNKGVDEIEPDNIDIGVGSVETEVTGFVDTYKEVFDSLVIWFETMEERMANSVDGLKKYFEYLMYVRRIIDSGGDFKILLLGENNETVRGKNTTISDDATPTPQDSGGGDTFIFNSPKAIDEVEAARQLRRVKRNIAEGF